MRGKFAREWYKKGEILLTKYEQNVKPILLTYDNPNSAPTPAEG
jgi:hypothetical protein